ncbi:hypothetical protein [Micromonospora thermarum]|uniref:Uncharacterized protein n=1 Tax=Micromonospora thermarum TaxID=2720024 RepID=A0ABX0ZB68_9ACTN|nr:hypothetical protein [Micromonospora thermarum]NJP35155.1 hypothetical protein [Micromonospora thermarum]
MFFRRSARADRAALDRLLDAAATDHVPGAGTEPLARLLSAAAAPGRPDELAGEEAALAAFRAARATPARAPEPTRRRRPVTAGVAAWAAGVAVTATAGVAFAAVAIDRPDAPPPRPRPTTGASDPGETGGPGGTPGGGASTGASSGTPSGPPAPTTGPPAPTAGASATRPGSPSPRERAAELDGQCRAYLAMPPAQRERALDTPGFADLVTAAGGRAQVTDYCRDRVGEPEPPTTREPKSGPTPAASATP